MAKSKAPSAFDEILSVFQSDEDRLAFTGLADRYPAIKEYGLRQSDYSRSMQEMDHEKDYLNRWKSWEQENWDGAKGMTKGEVEKAQQLEALQAEKDRLSQLIEFGSGGEMDFAELEKWGKDFREKNNLVSSDIILKEKKALEDKMNALNLFTAQAAVEVPFLNRRYEKEFGDQFDPQQFLKDANEKGRTNLREFYDEWTREARDKKTTESHRLEMERLREETTQQIAKQKEQADAELARLRGMSPGGSPTDGGEAISSMKAALLGIKTDKDNTDDAPGAVLGGGGIAAVAAQRFRETGSV